MRRPARIHVSEPFLPFFPTAIEWPEGRGKFRLLGDMNELKDSLRALDLYAVGAPQQLNAIGMFAQLATRLKDVVYPLNEEHPGAVYPITGKELADLIPWEALTSESDVDLPFNPVRSDASARPAAPLPARPLRVVLVMGHEGPEQEFDIQNEVNIFVTNVKGARQVTDRLEGGGFAGVLRLANASSQVRSEFFKTHLPDVVIYFGHGRSIPRPAVRVGPGDDDWLDLRDLASSASGASYPSSWIFLACSLGEAPLKEPGPSGPEAFRILSTRGARAMVAMRSRIRPPMARLVGLSLLESIVAGVPLELAAADARRAARRSREGHGTLIDWAAPAVWSTIVGFTPILGANVAPALVAAKLTRNQVEASEAGLQSPQPWAIKTATRWLNEERLTFSISPADRPSRSELIEIAGAMSRETARPIILVDFDGAQRSQKLDSRLRDWGRKVRKVLSFADAETILGRAVESIADGDLGGLETLLGLEGLVLILPVGPDPDDHTAWRLLEQSLPGRTIAIGVPGDALQSRQAWKPESANAQGAADIPELVFAKAPKTLAILASQDEALDLASLKAVTGEESPLEGNSFLIETMVGRVLSPSARRQVRDRLGEGALIDAHRLMFEARAAGSISSDDEIAILRDLIGWGGPKVDSYTKAIVDARQRAWSDADWLRLAKTLERAEVVLRSLQPSLVLHIAGLYAQRQQTGRARLWLEAAKPTNPVDRARQAAIESECLKASADEAKAREAMMARARAAVAELEQGAGDIGKLDLLRHRVNLARLELYFDHKATSARDIYLEAIAQLDAKNLREAPLLVASLRNLAECLFEFPPFQGKADLEIAYAHLSRAQKVATNHKLDAHLAEVLYSTAKLAEQRGDPQSSRFHLLNCIAAAERGNHFVCERIAEMRRFWLDDKTARDADPNAVFNYGLFAERLRRLELSESHAWARRYARQSRLKAVHRLEVENDVPWDEIRDLLVMNLETFVNRNDVSSSTDRMHIALSYAGLAMVAERQGSEGGPDAIWEGFKDLPWAPDWLQAQPSPDRSGIWAEGN